MRALAAIALVSALFVAPSAWPDPFELPLDRDVIVEGSTINRGLQPDYLISPRDEHLQPIFRHAEEIANSGLDYWGKVASVRDLVSNTFFIRDYDNPFLHELMATYRERRRPIPLGSYVRRGIGVCRESYLLLHLALKHAGIDNRAVYAEVAYDRAGHDREDHGMVVLEGKGKGVTVDAFNRAFDGLRFSQLEQPKGVDGRAPVSPATHWREPGFRRVVKVRSFPRVKPLRRR